MPSFITSTANYVVALWPMVKLTTINKALPGDTPDYQKKGDYYKEKPTFLFNKSKNMLSG